MKKVFYLLFILMTALIIRLLFWSAAYWNLGRTAELQSTPGAHLLDLGNGRRVFAVGKKASQNPTAIFLHGGAGTHKDWAHVIDQLPKNMNWWTYDRLGVGWSDAATTERSLDALVTELATALQQDRVLPPYLLVGYSYGGMIALEFARQHGHLSAALLLVDPVHPGQFDDTVVSAQGQKEDRDLIEGLETLPWKGFFGFQRMKNALKVFASHDAVVDVFLTDHHRYGTAQEMKHVISNTFLLRERKNIALNKKMQCLTLAETEPFGADLAASHMSQKSMTDSCGKQEFEPVAGAVHEFFITKEYSAELAQKIMKMMEQISPSTVSQ